MSNWNKIISSLTNQANSIAEQIKKDPHKSVYVDQSNLQQTVISAVNQAVSQNNQDSSNNGGLDIFGNPNTGSRTPPWANYESSLQKKYDAEWSQSVNRSIATSVSTGAIAQFLLAPKQRNLPFIGNVPSALQASLCAFIGTMISEYGRDYNIRYWDLIDYYTQTNYEENTGPVAQVGEYVGVPLHGAFLTEVLNRVSGNANSSLFFASLASQFVAQELINVPDASGSSTENMMKRKITSGKGPVKMPKY